MTTTIVPFLCYKLHRTTQNVRGDREQTNIEMSNDCFSLVYRGGLYSNFLSLQEIKANGQTIV